MMPSLLARWQRGQHAVTATGARARDVPKSPEMSATRVRITHCTTENRWTRRDRCRSALFDLPTAASMYSFPDWRRSTDRSSRNC